MFLSLLEVIKCSFFIIRTTLKCLQCNRIKMIVLKKTTNLNITLKLKKKYIKLLAK